MFKMNLILNILLQMGKVKLEFMVTENYIISFMIILK